MPYTKRAPVKRAPKPKAVKTETVASEPKVVDVYHETASTVSYEAIPQAPTLTVAQTEKTVDPYAGKTIRLQVKNAKRLGAITIRGINHPDTGIYMPLKDVNGNDTVFVINKAVFMLKLDDPYERQVYEIAKVHPHYYYHTPWKKYELIDEIEDANISLKAKEDEVEAYLLLKTMNSIELSNFARLFGIQTDTVKEVVIKKLMYDKAADTPEQVIAEFNNPERPMRELLHRARQKGVVDVRNGIWYYNEQPLGESFDRALLWLKSNEDLIPIIVREADKSKR